jgi:hypothetical protein
MPLSSRFGIAILGDCESIAHDASGTEQAKQSAIADWRGSHH